MPELPYEIWLEVVQYLPPEKLFQIGTLNRHLRSIALDERYKKAQIHYHGDAKTRDFLTSMRRSPVEVAPRVRSLLLRPHAFGASITMKPGSGSKDARFLLESLTKLVNLRTLDLQCYHYRSFLATGPYISAAFRVAYTHSLQSLRLLVPLEAYRDMGLSTITLSHLRHLDIRISMAYLTSDPHHLCQNYLAPFINNHRATLESLTLSNLNQSFHYPLDPIFTGLKYFSRLSSLDLSFFYVGPSQTMLTGAHSFLEAHSSQIRTLKINLDFLLRHSHTLVPEWKILLSGPLFGCPLPRLKSLTLGLTKFPAIKDIVQYISLHKHTLTEFNLTHKIVVFSELQTFISVFEGGPLRSLSFRTRILAPPVLSLLSTKLPQLHRLKVSYDTWGGTQELDGTFYFPGYSSVSYPTLCIRLH
ncbi:hypothetical protein CC2G_007031 [Coprinopsis cinerea AmutBmut pab1-1]|nr:hypothetical protein CC2G_007031 [Coprinopsis cinerea AmutBmut pab1-1]